MKFWNAWIFILFRNNLTIIDAIVVQGQGGRGEMKLSNKRPGSAIPLQFDITEKHLKNCDSKCHKCCTHVQALQKSVEGVKKWINIYDPEKLACTSSLILNTENSLRLNVKYMYALEFYHPEKMK